MSTSADHCYYEWRALSHNTHQSLLLNSLPIPSDTNTFDIYVHFHMFLESTNQCHLLQREHLQFRLDRNRISSTESARASAIASVIILALPSAETWFIEYIVPILSQFVFQILSHPRNRNKQMLSMSVAISHFLCCDEGGLLERVMRRSMEDNNLGFKPASKAFVDALERVRVEDCGEGVNSMEDCVICMEKESAGEEVIVLPCKHVFHGDCILKWLETSHLCPLCRSPMPIDD